MSKKEIIIKNKKSPKKKKISLKNIKKLFEGFIKIDNKDIDDLPTNSFLRYVVIKNGKKEFKIGGYLSYIHKKYVYLQNYLRGKLINWCVQRNKNYYFFKKIDFRDETEIVLLEQEKKINLYKKVIKQQNKKINLYENIIEQQEIKIKNYLKYIKKNY